MALVVFQSTRYQSPPSKLTCMGGPPGDYAKISTNLHIESDTKTNSVLQFPSNQVVVLP